MEKEDIDFTIRCPFCGSQMCWDSDYINNECDEPEDGRTVRCYSCHNCGSIAEFLEGDKSDFN